MKTFYMKYTQDYGGTPDFPVYHALWYKTNDAIWPRPIRRAYIAVKIWCQYDDGRIEIIKDRYEELGPVKSEEQIEEFKIVKLSATMLN